MSDTEAILALEAPFGVGFDSSWCSSPQVRRW
jgi:hypothetical protein